MMEAGSQVLAVSVLLGSDLQVQRGRGKVRYNTSLAGYKFPSSDTLFFISSST